ncbi:MAG: ornithine racemase Orr [Fusobacterium gastrosuis]|uniref:ornithine racemase Orr n=1 Tax=Fusobacterium gastrosuis TaxID=1755100 RepID=UPI001F4F3259|nr:ornithine racemase Orr [Fusobacterium gastrosuis]MDD7391954.1 ornithine racemase Orr [Fusobacteriaceae bacterium]MDY5795360.1 ornithine racemase Orr [Fusobacterium gastrosuis]
MYPKLEINIPKLKENLKAISTLLKKENLSLTMVTKAYCADEYIVSELSKTGLIDYLADSRVENLKNFQKINIPKILLRIPMISEVSDLIDYVDISFNSEYETIKKINEEAKKKDKVHRIVIMVDLGDLREGFFEEKDLFENIEKIKKLENINIIGLATNLTCYGAVLPSEENLSKLVSIAEKLKLEYKLNIQMISGGNSSSLFLINQGKLPKNINNLRIGEAILLGRETAYGSKIDGTYDDAFKLICEIVENKKKVSVPIGEQGMDAFGNKPVFVDKGFMQRAILGIGRQDVAIDSMYPVDELIEIIGASSDHTIVDITNSQKKYVVGDKIEFKLGYSGIMSASTSKYVKKQYLD